MSEEVRQSLLVDTNIFLRFITGDDPAKAVACKDLFERAARKEIDLYTNEMVLAELAWTLRSFYRRPREEIAGILRDIIGLGGLRVPRKAMLLEALDLYERFNVDYLDAYNAADLRARGLGAVCSYDSHFDRLGVARVAPGEG